ncbi:hypothetical protein V6U71_07885 [Sphingopyxis sp. J-6]|uniref:hypothetical protein n=1 Tax=Sphingopyxis sp. J-6 TaxID=3122054 RepID=UPI00398416C7
MKRANPLYAVFAALTVAIGITLSAVIGTAALQSHPEESQGVMIDVKPWPEATHVRVFVKDISYDEFERTGKNMSNPEGVLLSATQRAILDKSVHLYRMTPNELENNAVAGCFIPHHFFRYYDARGRQLGELAVCYCCMGIEFSPALKSLESDEEWRFDFPAVKKMLDEMRIPTNVNC